MDTNPPQPPNPIYDLKEKFKNHSNKNPLFFLFVLLLLPVSVIGIQQTLTYFSKAQTVNTVILAFTPSSVNVPPRQNVKIMLNTGSQKVAFARVVFTFDKSKININSEITTSASLSTIVQKSTMSQANNQGSATIVIAASPSDTQPSGNFEFASFSITGVTQSAIGSAAVIFNANDLQIVEASGAGLTPQVQNLSINGGTINPTNPAPTGVGSSHPSPTVPAVANPPTACQNKTLSSCFFQWVREFIKVDNTKYADFDQNSVVDLNDFESIRRALFP